MWFWCGWLWVGCVFCCWLVVCVVLVGCVVVWRLISLVGCCSLGRVCCLVWVCGWWNWGGFGGCFWRFSFRCYVGWWNWNLVDCCGGRNVKSWNFLAVCYCYWLLLVFGWRLFVRDWNYCFISVWWMLLCENWLIGFVWNLACRWFGWLVFVGCGRWRLVVGGLDLCWGNSCRCRWCWWCNCYFSWLRWALGSEYEREESKDSVSFSWYWVYYCWYWDW